MAVSLIRQLFAGLYARRSEFGIKIFNVEHIVKKVGTRGGYFYEKFGFICQL